MKKTVLAIASTIILAPTFAMASDHSNNNKHESAIAYTGPIEVKIKTGYTLNPCLVIAPNAARL